MNKSRLFLALLVCWLLPLRLFAQQPVVATLSTTDPDDASIAVAQTNGNVNALNMVYDGTVWRRLTIGVAGTASAQVLSVQGIASMTPVQVSQATASNLQATVVGTGTFSVQCSSGCSGGTQYAEDLASLSADLGTMALTVRKATTPTDRSAGGTDGDYEPLQVDGNGRLYTQAVLYNSTGTELVIGTDQVLDAAIGTTGPLIVVRGSTAVPTAMSTDNDSTALWADLSGRLNVRNGDPCFSLPKSYVTFSVSSATTTQLIAASASNFNYICSFTVVAGAADNIALIEDDTVTNCPSPTAGMAGGTTAATGFNFAANGGIQAGTGAGTVFKTAATNRYTCVATSTTAQASGVISYVQAP